MKVNRFTRGNDSRFFVAGELSRRGYTAVVTSGKSPDTTVLRSNVEGTKTVHILVRTYVPGSSSCAVGVKAEEFSGDYYFWILAGIPYPRGLGDFEYYIIPNRVVVENEPKYHRRWLETPDRNDRAHQDTNMRVVLLLPNMFLLCYSQ